MFDEENKPAESGEEASGDSGAGALGAFSLGGGGALGALTQSVTLDWSSPANLINSAISWLSGVNGIFLMLAVIQGLFAGLVIGKLSEGFVMAGLKHSFALVLIALFAMSLAQQFA